MASVRWDNAGGNSAWFSVGFNPNEQPGNDIKWWLHQPQNVVQPMNTYRCKFSRFAMGYPKGEFRAYVMLLDDHLRYGGRVGEMCTTSKVRFMDFERGIIVTQNSIYLIEGYIT